MHVSQALPTTDPEEPFNGTHGNEKRSRVQYIASWGGAGFDRAKYEYIEAACAGAHVP
jgi:hypothetical protein